MCGGVHYEEVEGLVSVERWSCRWVLPFLATKSAVLSTMSGHCQGEDSASKRGMERHNNRKHHPRNHVTSYSHT